MQFSVMYRSVVLSSDIDQVQTPIINECCKQDWSERTADKHMAGICVINPACNVRGAMLKMVIKPRTLYVLIFVTVTNSMWNRCMELTKIGALIYASC